MKKDVYSKLYHIFAPFLIPLAIIVIWQTLSVNQLLSNSILPAPLEVLQAALEKIETGELFSHIGVSFQRALYGLVIGGGLGLIFGILNGISSILRSLLDSSIQMFRNIPHLALIPLVIVWFGVGEEAKIFLVAVGVFFPVYINTYHGIRSIDTNLIEMGTVYGLSKTKLFLTIILPGALPSILVGIRYALGVMWLTLIVAETLAASSGIGYMAMNAREFMQLDVVVLAILLYALLGKLADSLTKMLENRLLKWNVSYKK